MHACVRIGLIKHKGRKYVLVEESQANRGTQRETMSQVIDIEPLKQAMGTSKMPFKSAMTSADTTAKRVVNFSQDSNQGAHNAKRRKTSVIDEPLHQVL
jgi:hypothetical protein